MVTKMEYMIDKVENLKSLGLISFDKHGCKTYMPYEGKVAAVLDKLKAAFQKSDLERDKELFLYANRLLIGIIDYALQRKANLLETKQEAENFCLEAFRGNYEAAKRMIENMKFSQNLLKSEVKENEDNISWSSFDPEILRKLIRKLGREVNYDFVVLDGHDSYRPGFMVADSIGSKTYAIRNAQDSGRDSTPRLLVDEEAYIRENFYDKNILIFGEDVSTGRAISSLSSLVERVSRPKNIVTASSIFIPGSSLEIRLDYYGEEKNRFR